MKFRTEYISHPHPNGITYNSSLFFIGSCFATNISRALTADKFKVFSNPHGIVYNPLSIAKQLTDVATNRRITPTDVMEFNGQWLSLEHHGDFTHSNKEQAIGHMDKAITDGFNFIQTADKLFITLGTAWYYTYNPTEQLVANCHKIPAHFFTKKLAEVNQMVDALTHALHAVRKLNPQLDIIFSISPVRHLSNGFFENNLSKARLFEVVHQLQQRMENVYYFAAYEMVMDDLRDYRFFNRDLVHPSEEAIAYVLAHFEHTYFHSTTQQQRQHVQKLVKASTHRPFNWHSEAHQKFITSTQHKMEQLGHQLGVDFSAEITQLQKEA
jgi:hypothetical protein